MNYDLWKSTVPPDEAPTLVSSPVVCVGGCGHRGASNNFAGGRWCWSCWSREHRRRLETEPPRELGGNGSTFEDVRAAETNSPNRETATREPGEDADEWETFP